MQDNIIKVYKKPGETPLNCINNLKKSDERLVSIPMTYAGRLDPQAEGLLIILIGDECHNKQKYLDMNKEYEVEVLFGFSTDTYDVMGKITGYKDMEDNQFDFILKLKKTLNEFIGKIKQKYPPYSSKTVNGKPLFMWAREERLNEIEIPTHDVFVEKIEIENHRVIDGSLLLSLAKEKVSLVKGDFRQEEIISTWKRELDNKKQDNFLIVKLRINCGSGVYVRSIADEIGEKLGIPSLALKIVRTKIGNYKI